MSKKILFVAGGMNSEHLFESGIHYSATIDLKNFEGFEIIWCVLLIDGRINFPKSLKKEDYETAEKFDIFEACSQIKKMGVSAIVYLPSSWKGLTAYRTVFELLNIPILGPSAESQTTCFNKINTRAKLASEGILIPPGVNIYAEEKNDLNKIKAKLAAKDINFPVVVKAPCEDDSVGLHVVKQESDLLEAVKDAFSYQNKNEILIEKFIRGREIRTAVIQNEKRELVFLPVCEYGIQPDKIRESKHKIYDYLAAKGKEMEIIERKILNEEQDKDIIERLKTISLDCFKYLNINDWAVFDYRYDTEEDKFYFIEAGLFIHFSPSCNIGKLAGDIGITQKEHFNFAYENAIKRFEESNKP